MKDWSFDILRSSDWNLWFTVLGAACLGIIGYTLFASLWNKGRRGWLSLALAGAGLAGTAAVVGIAPLRRPGVLFVWTLILLSLLTTIFYLDMLDRLPFRKAMLLLSLRLAALLAAVPMLFEPGCRFTRQPRPERPVLFCIDTSGSMSVPDAPNGPTRIASIWQTLSPELSRIDDHFLPQYFTFATTLESLPDPRSLEKMTADGKSTDLVNAITKSLGQVTQKDAAVVLITDGNDNTSADVIDAISRVDHPVYTVRVGSDQAEPANLPNIAVTDVDASEDFVVGQQTQIRATIQSTALPNRVVDVQMAEVDDRGSPISAPQSQTLVLQPLPQGQIVSLPYTPKSAGVHRLAVWVDPVPGERTTVDNRQEFQGLAIDPRIKVLYIEGRLRPEYRDINRMLGHDPNVELATLLRIVSDRFEAAGSVDGQAFKQMPSRADDWKKFDVILLGDLDSSFLSPIQQQQIEQRTLDGGGLCMIGGQTNFGAGHYQDTPIERALPVLVGSGGAGQDTQQFIPQLTAPGLLNPAMQGLTDYFGSAQTPPSKTLPPLRGNIVVAGAKPSADVLLVHPGKAGPDGKPEVVLAVQRYGKGRAAALTIDTTYLWALPLYGLGQDSPYNRFWGQLIRWLAGTDVRNRDRGPGLEGLLNKNVYTLGESVRLRALVRDQRGDATQFAQVTLKLSQADKPEQSFSLDPAADHIGMYELSIPHPGPGEWKMSLSAAKDGKPLGQEQLKFTVIPPADEMLKIAANPKLLAAIAHATGASAYDLPQLPALIDELIRSNPDHGLAKSVFLPFDDFPRAALMFLGKDPAWPTTADLPIQGCIMLLLLATEWILRRVWELS